MLETCGCPIQQDPQQHKTNKSKPADTPRVGPCNEGVLKVNGDVCKAIFDSDTNVTTITDDFWHRDPVLCSQKPQPSDMPIEGSTGQTVSQVGVLYTNLKFLGGVYTNVAAFIVPIRVLFQYSTVH